MKLLITGGAGYIVGSVITNLALQQGYQVKVIDTLWFKKDIKKGEKLSLDNLWFKRTVEESPIKQNQFLQLIGLRALQDIKEDEVIDFTKIEYKFKKADLEDYTHVKKDGGRR